MGRVGLGSIEAEAGQGEVRVGSDFLGMFLGKGPKCWAESLRGHFGQTDPRKVHRALGWNHTMVP